MNNVISFEEAKARKDKLVDVSASKTHSTQMPGMKSVTALSTAESLFIREARRFKFVRVSKPPTFVIMNNKNLPPPFPPDSPPPLVA